MLVDVRSQPWSRRHPQYRRDALRQALSAAGIEYRFMGDALGARPRDPACYVDGRVSYGRIAARPAFAAALHTLLALGAERRPALMCAEREPLECHRTVLVSRRLVGRGARVEHLLADGRVEPHAATMARLRAAVGLPDADLFADTAALDEQALALAEQRMTGGG